MVSNAHAATALSATCTAQPVAGGHSFVCACASQVLAGPPPEVAAKSARAAARAAAFLTIRTPTGGLGLEVEYVGDPSPEVVSPAETAVRDAWVEAFR